MLISDRVCVSDIIYNIDRFIYIGNLSLVI